MNYLNIMNIKEKNLSPVDKNKIRLAQLSKGLAHPARVEIVRMLEKKPREARCVCGDIVNALPLAQSSVSQHLKTLKETGWIQGEIDGPRVCYCLIDGVIDEYTSLMNRTISDK
jgi:DNA-binding transcriptional ArsR family regulator